MQMPKTTVAIEPGSTRLFTGAERTNNLAADPEHGQWTRRTREGDAWVLERDVTEIDLRPISSWTDPLYVVLVLEPDSGALNDAAIRRFLITFL